MRFVALSLICCSLLLGLIGRADDASKHQTLPTSIQLVDTAHQSAWYTVTPFDEALACLKQQRICINQGVQGITPDTSARIAGQLSQNDHIAIVILSTDGFATASSLPDFARQLDDATGHQYIFGLSTGKTYVGYASFLPAGVASDLMQRADGVSDSIQDTHTTFIRNVHNYQSQHPDAKPLPNPEQPTPDSSTSGKVPGWLGISLLTLVVMIGVGLMFFTAGGASKPNKIQFTAPDPIKEHLEAIMKIREDIRDSNVGSLVEQGCLDTNRYFARNRNSKYIDSDVELFSGHLRLLLEVLQAYVDVQNSQRYNVEYQSLMECGREAAQGYADFALSCNQREANLRAETFKVNTAILSAQRFNPDLP